MAAPTVLDRFAQTNSILPGWLNTDGPPPPPIAASSDATLCLVESLPYKRWPERNIRAPSEWIESHNTVNWVAFLLQCGGDIASEPCSCCALGDTRWVGCVVAPPGNQALESAVDACANCFFNGMASSCHQGGEYL